MDAAVGAGSLPGYSLPSWGFVVPAEKAEVLAARLRVGNPSVFCRVEEGGLVFDLRAVPPELDSDLIRAIRYARSQE
jgi:L-seryl-tRNA(Ser) seleniumtransferase